MVWGVAVSPGVPAEEINARLSIGNARRTGVKGPLAPAEHLSSCRIGMAWVLSSSMIIRSSLPDWWSLIATPGSGGHGGPPLQVCGVSDAVLNLAGVCRWFGE